ncbi:response regulator [Paenibacillus gansuensis]|uniref:Response regulator n=1 Tax=Paenibacillus gansuensis TaxID=306542 RepID=A0ABW5P8S3_9BACL
MINMMIVDDESIFREYLKTTIDWGQYGFQITAEGKNGVHALEQAELHPPDIALLDINMPFMDGIELAEKLLERYPHVRIVLITGHSEFEYARKAIRLGVKDYILKPFTKEELLLTMLKIRQDIEIEQQEKTTAISQQAIMKERLLNRMISKDYNGTQEDTVRQLDELGIRAQSGLFQVACIEIDHLDQKWNEVSEKLLWKFAVTNVLGEIIQIRGSHLMFTDADGRIVSLLEFEDEAAVHEFDKDDYGMLCQLIKKHLKFTITIGLGSVHNGYNHIYSSYMEALVSLQNKFNMGNDRCIEYERYRDEFSGLGFYPAEMNERLLGHMRSGESAKVAEQLTEMFRYIREQRTSVDHTYMICMNVISLCLSFVTEAGYDVEDVYSEGFSPFSELKKLESIHETEKWMKHLYKQAVEYAGSHRMTKARKNALAAKEYIDGHYADPELSVERIAGHIYINSSYLRSIFKKEWQTTVSDYITHVRLQKAKELITAGRSRLSDISEQVGYNDAGYFSKAFKKYVGMTPSEYENTRN